jgi:formylmethanofuran:tetrahydromethanopterin formyltransferase
MTAATARRTTKKAAAAVAAALVIPELAKGERYVGAIAGPDGRGHHVILLAGDKDMIAWPDAMAWAKEQGGDLPNRVEQALLFAHHKKLFKERAYWSNAQDADDERWAWYQTFGTGGQSYTIKVNKLRARAVRRVPL